MINNEYFKNKIKEFMYASDLKLQNSNGSKLVSNAYLRTIIASIFSDNSRISPYSIIAGDFNKLRQLNSKYSVEEVNHCMEKCLGIIAKELPSDTLLTRYAGDEFLFILPSVSDKETANEYIEKIYQNIDKQKSSFHDLTITLASAMSQKYASLYQMYNHADKKIYKQKAEHDNENISLDSSFRDSLDDFFSSMRLSDGYKMTKEQIHKIITDAWAVSSDMINNYKNTGKVGPDKESSNNITFPNSVFSPTKASIIHNMLTTDTVDSSNELVNGHDLQTLAKSLVFDEHSKAFTKEYFTNFLINSLSNSNRYNLSLMSLSGLKLSNLLNGHVSTDKLMYRNYDKINSCIDNNMFFKEDPFAINKNDCFKISLGGGNILFITPENIHIPIETIVDRVNSNNNLLDYVSCSSQSPIKPSDMLNFIEHSRSKSDKLKDKFKSTLIGTDLIRSVLGACLHDDVKGYCENNPDYMNPNKLKDFLSSLSSSIQNAAQNYECPSVENADTNSEDEMEL